MKQLVLISIPALALAFGCGDTTQTVPGIPGGGGAPAAGTGGAPTAGGGGAPDATAGSMNNGGAAPVAGGGAGGAGGAEPPPAPVCGDGKVEGSEQCDDGNTTPGDGCDALCVKEATAECGNGAMDAGEECDDGNNVDGDGCQANCTITPACGDGAMNTAEEECDDGNTMDGDGCSAMCKTEAACGDGKMDAGEECDDGNTMDGDACNADCTLPADLASYAAELHGETIIMPCGTFTSTEVCTPVNIGRSFQGDPGLQGQISHYKEITFGGDPGTMYEVTVHVRGLVESKQYNGGMDRDSSGTQIPADGLYIGGTPDNSSNGYNVYRLRTESPAQNYFLNSVGVPGNNRMCHCVFDTDYDFTFDVEGGSKIIVSSADPNNSAIANCGIAADNVCAGTEVSLTDLDPEIADDIGAQPYNGQFLGFIVKDVKVKQ